jgi:hypothetical protein
MMTADYTKDLEQRVELLEKRLEAYDFFVVEAIEEIEVPDEMFGGLEADEMCSIDSEKGWLDVKRLYTIKGRGEEEIQFLAGISESKWFPTNLDYFFQGVGESVGLELFVRHGKYGELAESYEKLFGDRGGRKGKPFRKLPVEFKVYGR